MGTRLVSWLVKPRVLRTLLSDARLALRLLRDPAVAPFVKLIPFAALAYIFSPLDILPDVFPVVGQLDDLGILILGLQAFLRVCPAEASAFHREALALRRPYSPMTPPADVIDAEFWRS